jgi:HEAT repeat protein
MINQYDKVNQLLIQLYSKNADFRRNAVEELSSLISKRVLYRLVEHLDDSNKGVQDAISQILFENAKDYPEIADQLIRYLFINDIEIRNLACEVLIHIGESAIEPMKYALKCDDRDVRKFVADIYGFIGSTKSIPYLIEAFDDEDSNVGFSSIEAIGTIGDISALVSLERVIVENFDLRAIAIEAVGKISDEKSISVICKFINDEDPMVVYGCIDALGNIHSKKSLETLLSTFDELDEVNKENAVNSIFRIIKEFEVHKLDGKIFHVASAMLDEATDDDLPQLIFAFSKVDHPNVLMKLTEKLEEQNEDINSLTFNALLEKEFSDESVIIDAIDKRNGLARDLIISLIGYKKITSAVEKLVVLANKESEELKVTIISTLANFPEKIEAQEFILSSLEVDNENIKIASARALGYMQNEASFDKLLEILNTTDNEELAFTILETFVLIGSDKSLKFFIDMIATDDIESKSLALQAINQISSEKAKPYINEFLDSKSDEKIGIAIGLIAENSYIEFQDKLINDLKHTDAEIQKSILDALAQIDALGNFDTFIQYLNHKEKWVQVHALDVLINKLAQEFLSKLECIELKKLDEVTRRPLMDFLIDRFSNENAMNFLEMNYQFLEEDQELELLNSDNFKALNEKQKSQFYQLSKLDIEKVIES